MQLTGVLVFANLQTEASNTDMDLYGWGLTNESAQDLMHELFDMVEESGLLLRNLN